MSKFFTTKNTYAIYLEAGDVVLTYPEGFRTIANVDKDTNESYMVILFEGGTELVVQQNQAVQLVKF